MAGRPPVLSRDDFITAARALLEEVGPDGLTTRALGSAMGVDPTSLYRHFASRDALLVAVIDSALNEMFADLDLVSGTPRERLARLARRFRDVFGHMGKAAALSALVTTPQPHGEFSTRIILDLLREMGISEPDIPMAYQSLESLAVGMTSFDFTSAPDHTNQRARRYRATNDPALADVGTDPARVSANDSAAFDFALDAVLDALEHLARRRPRKSDSNPE
jgi:AcrR family transcriptional regulator